MKLKGTGQTANSLLDFVYLIICSMQNFVERDLLSAIACLCASLPLDFFLEHITVQLDLFHCFSNC